MGFNSTKSGTRCRGAVHTNNLPDALRSYRDALAIGERLAKADTGNAGWQRDLSVSFSKIGDVLVAQGNLPDALRSYRDALAIAERLAKADTGNALWQRDLATAHERVGAVYVRQGQRDEARLAFERALQTYAVLAARNPGDVQSRVSSVVPLWQLAVLDPGKARAYLTSALGILQPLAQANRLDARRLTWIPAIVAQLAALKP